MAKSWQQALLSSGLPLENDVFAYLRSAGCLPHFHYSYLKADEFSLPREFSYDIDAAYILGGHFFELMVECKYRHQSARWVFAPDEYGGYGEVDHTDVLHPFDHFIPHTFPYRGGYPVALGPLCSAGTEIVADGANEKTITQAVTQLAYAFGDKLVSAMEHQVKNLLSRPTLFYHVHLHDCRTSSTKAGRTDFGHTKRH